jgi:hypothetical protein
MDAFSSLTQQVPDPTLVDENMQEIYRQRGNKVELYDTKAMAQWLSSYPEQEKSKMFDLFKGSQHPDLQPYEQKRSQIRTELMDSYVAIYEAAKEGKPIAAVDFEQVEKRYSQKMKRLLAEVEKKVPAIVRKEEKEGLLGGAVPIDPFADNQDKANLKVPPEVITQRIRELATNFRMAGYLEVGMLEDISPKAQAALTDHQVYDDALARRHGAFPRKDLSLSPGVNTREELLHDVLSKNPGVAVGDIHIFGEAASFITQQIKTLKESKVDTLYLEANSEMFDKYQNMSIAELKKLVAERKYKDNYLFSPADKDPNNPEKTRLDNDGTYVEMLIALRENNIRVVNIDKPEPGRSFETMEHRIATTNMTWVELVQEDRKKLAAQGKRGGKYVVWTGYDHLIDNDVGDGRVDDVLGVPVLAFEPGRKDSTQAFRRGISENEPDFYLPGGMQMYSMQRHTHIADLHDVIDTLNPLANLSGIADVIAVMKAQSRILQAAEGKAVEKITHDKFADMHPDPFVPKLPIKAGQPEILTKKAER